MARIFITGSADGLGHLAAKILINQGHQVVLHARNKERGSEALRKLPGAENVLTGDLSSIEETEILAEQVNEMGSFDAVIHNAGVYQSTGKLILAVNILAPYILTCLIQKPKRLVYLSSGMHLHGDPTLRHLSKGDSHLTYSDSKLHVLILAKAVARRWPDSFSNAVNPGWVPTRMGGRNAPDNLEKGAETQVWLAVSDDDNARVSGRYFFHQKESRYLHQSDDILLQEKFLSLCEKITGLSFPG